MDEEMTGKRTRAQMHQESIAREEQVLGWWKDDQMTQRAIAERLGVSAPRARQILMNGLWRLAHEDRGSRGDWARRVRSTPPGDSLPRTPDPDEVD